MKVPFKSIRSSDDPNDLRARIQWMLGRKPNRVKWNRCCSFLTAQESNRKGYDRFRADNTARIAVCFGQNVRGNIYYNTRIKDPVAAVIWLHPYSYNTGYVENAEIQNTTFYHRLAQEGFVVLAYDQCGFGQRLLEGRDFYSQYPRWSRFGRMVYDVGTAVDFLVDGKGKSNGPMPKIRENQIYVLGYSLGGMVGLHAAALDTRIAGVASFSGFTPMRTDTDAGHTGGIRRLWEWHALLPKLGLYNGREDKIPYDFDDVLKLIAPRHCLIVSPTHDRDARINDVVACVNRARKALAAKGSVDHLIHLKPDDINRFQTDQQDMFLNWISLKTEGR
jgi:pimeloyl-ACP methyl ester carboxylesterase